MIYFCSLRRMRRIERFFPLAHGIVALLQTGANHASGLRLMLKTSVANSTKKREKLIHSAPVEPR
jgi:hypothetical protein